MVFPRVMLFSSDLSPASPDLHAQQTTSNLSALLVAPINSYQSVLTLLAIPNYAPLLTRQLFSTRRSIAHSIISSVLKNETIVESPEDVDGVLELCHVLIKDQSDSSAPGAAAANNAHAAQGSVKDVRRQGPYYVEREEMAEEQGWVARMVHLFRAESLDIQFEVRQLCLIIESALLKYHLASASRKTAF
jgi:vacuolar protein sorting-associated protein 35